MPKRFDPDQLGPEIQSPEFVTLMLAFLDVAEGDVLRAEEFRAQGKASRSLTLVGWTILMHIFVVAVANRRGTRTQNLIETLAVPRRTIRDTLKRMLEDGHLIRDKDGLYHPSQEAGRLAAEQWSGEYRLRQLRRACDAYEAFALRRRNTP